MAPDRAGKDRDFLKHQVGCLSVRLLTGRFNFCLSPSPMATQLYSAFRKNCIWEAFWKRSYWSNWTRIQGGLRVTISLTTACWWVYTLLEPPRRRRNLPRKWSWVDRCSEIKKRSRRVLREGAFSERYQKIIPRKHYFSLIHTNIIYIYIYGCVHQGEQCIYGIRAGKSYSFSYFSAMEGEEQHIRTIFKK